MARKNAWIDGFVLVGGVVLALAWVFAALLVAGYFLIGPFGVLRGA
jgi:hypothetical protein